jgi:hypothetical protein
MGVFSLKWSGYHCKMLYVEAKNERRGRRQLCETHHFIIYNIATRKWFGGEKTDEIVNIL